MAGAVRDGLAASRQLASDLADLERRRDLLPADGYERLVRDAKRDAEAKSSEAQQAAKRAYEQLEQSLLADAMPKLDPAREQLARDECHLAFTGSAQPETAALNVAAEGSDEVLAVLLTGWGRTLLAARGVRNVDDLLRRVRETAHHRVLARADTPA
ncbi:MAG TPA: hypothetical protein VFG75_07980, partial [Gaiella sp.]|nr:hypothetical protein [Gaiella sp.]